jgi:hypothetical protein
LVVGSRRSGGPQCSFGHLTIPGYLVAIDLDKVIFNPTFSQDLTSFQLK